MASAFLPREDADALLAAFLGGASDAIVGQQLDGTVAWWNPAAELLFGWAPHEIVGADLRRLIPPERWGEEDEVLSRVRRGERVPAYETVRLHRSGRRLAVSVAVSPLRTAEGVVVGASGIVRALAPDADPQAARLQRAVLDAAPDAVVAVDADGYVALMNPAAERMFGWPDGTAIGQALDVLLPAGARLRHAEAVAAFRVEADGARRMSRRTVFARHADGHEFPVEVTIGRVGTGAAQQLVAVAREGGALQDVDLALESARRAQADSAAKSAFLANVSHELRTPLTAVMGFAGMLASDPDTGTGRARALVGHIRSAGSHLLTLIDDLLDLARIEAGALVLRLEPMDAVPLLRELTAQLQTVAQSAGVDLRCEAEAPLWVRADATRLRQVVYNVLSNAIKYNRPRGSVWIEVATAGDRGLVRVFDTGIGMTPEQLERLFQPFDRLGREDGSVPGVGLGLSVAHDLVRRMDGELVVSSQVEVGTRVELRLPAAPAPGDPQGDTVPAPVPAAEPVPDLPPGHVLCVDDSPVNRLLVEAMLQDWPGLELRFAVDARSATEALHAQAPDLVLLDVHLPDRDGLAWLDALRDDPLHAATAVVVFTASAGEQARAAALALGALDCIGKPVDARDFRARIAHWLRVVRFAEPR